MPAVIERRGVFLEECIARGTRRSLPFVVVRLCARERTSETVEDDQDDDDDVDEADDQFPDS